MSVISQSAIVTRKNVESLGESVRLVDSMDGLDLFCYKECNKLSDPLLQKCRGLIFENDKKVLESFPYTIEYTDEDHEEIVNTITINNCLIYDSYEGATIKMFFYQDKWFIATNRKLDAFKSKWASKNTYGFYFKEALKYQFENNEELKSKVQFDIYNDDPIQVFADSVLDKNKQYMFLLLNNNENRIVCDEPPFPTIYHVGTFTNVDDIFVLNMDENIYIPYPNKYTFDNFSDIYNYVDSIDYCKLQGLIIFTENNKQFKILNKDYKELYGARGNEASINFRYLQSRMVKRTVDMLKYLYPNKTSEFEDYENILYDRAKYIHESYKQRYIRKQHVIVPKEEYIIMSNAHEWHQKDRDNNKISLDKIIEILNDQNPTILNRIIRRIKLEKKDTKKRLLGTNTEV